MVSLFLVKEYLIFKQIFFGENKLSCLVINEQKMCEKIFSGYLTVSDDKQATFLWKTKEIRKLMVLLENKDNSSVVSHAITFILSLNREEEPSGINVRNLSKDVREEILEYLKIEFQ